MLHRRGMLKIAAAFAGALGVAANALAADPASICFVYISPIGDSGWTFSTIWDARTWKRPSRAR